MIDQDVEVATAYRFPSGDTMGAAVTGRALDALSAQVLDAVKNARVILMRRRCVLKRGRYYKGRTAIINSVIADTDRGLMALAAVQRVDGKGNLNTGGMYDRNEAMQYWPLKDLQIEGVS